MEKGDIMNNFLVVEGICCSGKSTFCNCLKNELNKVGMKAYYNHGAFTYTDTGRELKQLSQNMDCPIGTSFYISDLIINTQNIIKPLIKKDNIIVQDRYFDSITTYIIAYGKYTNRHYNIDRIIDRLKENDILITPVITVYCIPPFETVMIRLQNSKNSLVHDFYRKNPNFFRLVYDENVNRCKTTQNTLIVDTSSNQNINESINEIIKIIKETHSHYE